MINNIFANMPPVVKNILLLNVIMYIITYLGQAQGIPMTSILGGYVFGSPFFEPYQMVTHFFMHGGFFHLLFNMFALVVFGSVLEQVWGPKRFFFFYVITALGAFVLHQLVGYFEVAHLKEQLIASGLTENNLFELKDRMTEGSLNQMRVPASVNQYVLSNYISGLSVPVVGASGAVFGVLVAFGMLFPNTRLMLLFPPIPIRAKYLVGIMIVLELYYTFNATPGDNVAHLAHIGGALVGFIMVLIWRKDRRKFY